MFVCFLKERQKGYGSGCEGRWEKTGRVWGQGAILRIYCIEKSIFNGKKQNKMAYFLTKRSLVETNR